MRTNRLRSTILLGLAASLWATPAILAGETQATEEGETFRLGVKAERRQSTEKVSIARPAPPLVEIDLGQFLKADDSAAIQMSTRIHDSLLPRGYRRRQEAEVATPSAYWATDVWAPTWSDFDLLLATPTAGPDPCQSR